MHQLVACNSIETWSVIFPIWWPDAPQWRGICSLFPLPQSCSRLQAARDMAWEVHTHTHTQTETPPYSMYPQLSCVTHTQCLKALLQFCYTTQQQYALKRLAVYFSERVKVSHLKDYLSPPWTLWPHFSSIYTFPDRPTHMHIRRHLNTWMNIHLPHTQRQGMKKALQK